MDNKSDRKTRFVSAQIALTRWMIPALITLSVLSSVNVAQAQTPTTTELLSGVLGTYNLTFFDADASPDNNRGLVATPAPSRVTFIIAAGGRLCTPDLNLTGGVASSTPLTRNGAVLWTNAFADLQINLRVVDNNADQVYEFQEIDYRTATGAPVGRFSLAAPGDFTAGTGTCGASTDPTAAQINAFFTSAELAFRTLFPSGPFTFTQTAAGSSYRFYASTGITLAVTAGQVYAKGGGYGTEYVAVGSFRDLTATGGINNIIRPASLDAFFAGTYLTTMSDTQPFSPIPTGTEVRYVITSSGQLCLSNRNEIFNPVILNNNTNFVAWIDTVQQRSYRQRITPETPEQPLDPAIGLLQVFSLSNIRYGEFDGVRTSLNAFCTDLDPQHPDTVRAPRIEKLFEVKEQLFPELYPASPIVQTQRTAQYTFRFYPQTNRFIAVSSGIVYEGTGAVSVAGVSSGGLEQVISATTAATSPFLPASFMVGTYDMVVSGASPLSTAPDGTRVRMVLTSNGTLCVDNVALTSPTAPRSALSDVSWTNMQVGLNAFMVVPSTQSAVTVHLTSSLGDSFGRLDGSRVNTRATCTSAAPSAAEIAAAEEYFILAERKFPQLMPAQSTKVDRTASGAITRLYTSTDVTISIVAGEVFARGGSFGANDVVVGNLTTLLPALREEVGQATKAAIIPVSAAGSYDMVVSAATPISPFAGRNRVRLVIGTNGDLCIDTLVSSNPRSEYTSTQIARWTHATTDINATIDFTDISTGLTVVLRNSVANSLGTLTGRRVSSNTFCSTSGLSTGAVQMIDEFFMLGERRYPDVLPGGAFTQVVTGPAVSRTYTSNSLVMTVVNDQVFVRGGSFGTTDTLFGNFSNLLSELRSTVGGDTRAAVVPASLSGTYEMLVSGANPLAPFANNSRTRVVLRTDGSLCINNVISSNPRSDYVSPQILRWTNTGSQLIANLDISDTSTGVVVSLQNTAGASQGTLTGNRISNDTFCSTETPGTSALQLINELFLLAERQYPDLLPAGNNITQTSGPAVSRRYDGNGLVLTVVNDQIFARGAEFGSADVAVGNLHTQLAGLRVLVGEDNKASVIPPALFGTYDMLVSNSNLTAQFANGSRVRVVVRQNGELCLNSLISSNPRSDYGKLQIANWTFPTSNFVAVANTADLTEGLVFNLRNTAGSTMASLTGNRISTDTYCSATALTAAQVQSVNELFMLAERQYPGQLVASGSNTLTTGPAVRRNYPGGLILTVVDNKVFARGGEFGLTDINVGPLDALLTELRGLVGADNRAAVIPAALAGTYDLLVSGANPFAPFANNSRMRVVLNTNGDLCLNSTIINNPRSDYGSEHIATWTQSTAGIIARLDMTDVNEGLIVQLSSTAGNSLGTLTGTRVNTDVFCSAAALSASEAQSVNNLIALAERKSPTLFASDPSNSTLNAGGAVWKTYASTSTVLSVVNNRVFARGGSFGATDFYLGTVPALTSQWLAEVGPPPAQTAQYNIRVTGSALVAITGMNPVTRLLNINQKQTYSLTELVDSNLPNIARTLLSGEISSPDSIVIADVSRINGVLYFKATLIKTTVVGSTTTTRRIEAQITMSL